MGEQVFPVMAPSLLRFSSERSSLFFEFPSLRRAVLQLRSRYSSLPLCTDMGEERRVRRCEWLLKGESAAKRHARAVFALFGSVESYIKFLTAVKNYPTLSVAYHKASLLRLHRIPVIGV